MNERIKEIEVQCWETRQVTDDVNSWQTSFNSQKFADMIIKECIGIVENLPAGYIDYRSQIEDAFRVDCIRTMKAHFEANKK